MALPRRGAAPGGRDYQGAPQRRPAPQPDDDLYAAPQYGGGQPRGRAPQRGGYADDGYDDYQQPPQRRQQPARQAPPRADYYPDDGYGTPQQGGGYYEDDGYGQDAGYQQPGGYADDGYGDYAPQPPQPQRRRQPAPQQRPDPRQQRRPMAQPDDYGTRRDAVDFSDDANDVVLSDTFVDEPDDEDYMASLRSASTPAARKAMDREDDEARKAREDAKEISSRAKKKDKLSTRRRHSRDSKLDEEQTNRNGYEKKAKTMRLFVIATCVLLVVGGTVSMFMPRKTLTTAEVTSIAQQVSNNTGFPLGDGAGIAQQFIKVYAETTGDYVLRNQMLSIYYNGVATTGADVTTDGQATDQNGGSQGGEGDVQDGSTNGNIPPASGSDNASLNAMSASSDAVKQAIVYGPYVYTQKALTKNSGQYTIGVVVYRTSGDKNNPQPVKDEKGNIIYKRMFFDVGVYWDDKTQKYAITPDSPTLVPETSMIARAAAPKEVPIGDGNVDKDLADSSMDSLIGDYMTAWAASKTSSIENLTTQDATPNAKIGLGGSVKLNGGVGQGVQYKVYDPVAGVDDLYRVEADVKWMDALDEQSKEWLGYTSTYIIYLRKSGSKFLVYDIKPKAYAPDMTTRRDN